MLSGQCALAIRARWTATCVRHGGPEAVQLGAGPQARRLGPQRRCRPSPEGKVVAGLAWDGRGRESAGWALTGNGCGGGGGLRLRKRRRRRCTCPIGGAHAAFVVASASSYTGKKNMEVVGSGR